MVDSEVMIHQLQENDFDVQSEDATDANIVIVNTCGFIDRAKEESINTILQFAEEKIAGLRKAFKGE